MNTAVATSAAAAWTPAEERTLHQFSQIVATQRRRTLRQVGVAVLFSAVLLYLVPLLIEAELLRHFSAWVACVACSDAAGCLMLYMLGHPRLSLAIYLIGSLVEAMLLAPGHMDPHRVLLVSNVLPSLACVVALSWKFFDGWSPRHRYPASANEAASV